MINPDLSPEEISKILLEYLSKELCRELGYEAPLTQIMGGYEAYLYKFKLKGAPEKLSGPLILRLFPRYYHPGRAEWDSVIQNVVADSGYPAPRVYFTCTDVSIMGGSFLVMEFIEGEPLTPDTPVDIPVILGKTQATLHNLDLTPIEKALKERGINEDRYRLDGKLKRLRDRIREGAHDWLEEGMRWLIENKPLEPRRLSVIHGDFHPMNLMMKDGEITGVLDLPNFQLCDSAMDVGFTLVLATVAEKELLPADEWERIIKQYLDAYREVRPLDERNIPYYKVLRCIMALREGADGQESWTKPQVVKNLTDEIFEITGIKITPTKRN